MKLYRYFLLASLFMVFISVNPSPSRAAFYTRTQTAITDSPVTKGEHIYQDKDKNNYSYNNQYRRNTRTYTRPYRNREKEAKTGFILGVLGYYFYPLAIPALILGIIAADRRNRYYKRAVAAIILGAIPIAVAIALVIVFILTI